MKGLELAEKFFFGIVKPLLDEQYPSLRYAAGLLGTGSEILGFDDSISTDHNWGPRLQLFLNDNDYKNSKDQLSDFFSLHLPTDFMGYSTHWTTPLAEEKETQLLENYTTGKINHRIEIYTMKEILRKLLAIETVNLELVDWFIIPEQKLLEFTSGKIFYDTIGEISDIRTKLHYYPDMVLVFKLIGAWDYISQEASFIGRTGANNDNLGSRIITARLVRMLIKISYLLERKYAPYSKWLTYGFSQLTIASELKTILENALLTDDWRKREDYICKAILVLIKKQNSLKITPEITLQPEQFYTRNIQIINLAIVITELWRYIPDDFPFKGLQIGGIDQIVDNTLVLSDSENARKIISLYKQ